MHVDIYSSLCPEELVNKSQKTMNNEDGEIMKKTESERDH